MARRLTGMQSVFTRTTILALGVAALVAPSAPVLAVSQAISMIYGDSSQKPVFVTFTDVSNIGTYAFLTCARSSPAKVGESSPAKGRDLSGRPFLRVASYWNFNVWKKYIDDPRLLPELKPESANQHGRLYPPTRDEPAVVVTTDATIQSALPIPGELGAFKESCTLTSEDLAVARRLGLPGFQE